MTTTTPTCTCAAPQAHVRPSGEAICLLCGLTIPAPPVPPVERP
jgi:hypothetical protein